MTKKLIRIPQRGPILGRPGGIIGPIHTPYYEELPTVRRMVQLGTSVIEVLANGEEKVLTVTNLLEEESGKVVAQAKAQAKPKTEKPAPVEEVKAAEPKQEEKKQNSYSGKNNTKSSNKGNNEVVEDATTKK